MSLSLLHMDFWSPAEVGIEEGSSEGESFTLSSLHRTSVLVPVTVMTRTGWARQMVEHLNERTDEGMDE